MTALYYVYAVEDARQRDQLEKHLRALKQRGVLSSVQSRAVGPGSGWRDELSPHVNKADIVLLLMSSDLLSSGYPHGVEASRVLARYRDGEARVYSVLLRPCNLKGTVFARLPTLPRDGKPVTRWSTPDAAFQAIASGIATPPAPAPAEAAPSAEAAPETNGEATAAPGETTVVAEATTEVPAAPAPAPAPEPTPAQIALQPEELGPDFRAEESPAERDQGDAASAGRFTSVARAQTRRVAQFVYRAGSPAGAAQRLEAALRAEASKGGRAETPATETDAPMRVIRIEGQAGGAAPSVGAFAAKGNFLVAAKVVGRQRPASDTIEGDPKLLAESVVRRMLARIPS